MKIFTTFYDKTINWSRHRLALRYLFAISFLESSFFPVPTAVMLMPMVLARPQRAYFLAAVATVASIAGGVFGYFIGSFLYAEVGLPILEFYDLTDKFNSLEQWFNQYGVWLVLLGGITPLPYKFFTIASGLFGFSLIAFITASAIGRAAQFFLVAAVLKYGGRAIENAVRAWGEYLGWTAVAMAVIAYLIWG